MPVQLGLTPRAAHGDRLCSARTTTRQEKLAAGNLAFTKLANGFRFRLGAPEQQSPVFLQQRHMSGH